MPRRVAMPGNVGGGGGDGTFLSAAATADALPLSMDALCGVLGIAGRIRGGRGAGVRITAMIISRA